MDINTLIDSLSKAVATDSALESFCDTKYGSSIKVFLNFDARKPPEAADCPCVCIYPSQKEYGNGPYRDTVEIVCLINDDSTETISGYENIIAYAGVTNVEEMRKLVLAAAAGVIEATSSISVEYDTITWFPFILVSQALEIITPYTIGSGDPATLE